MNRLDDNSLWIEKCTHLIALLMKKHKRPFLAAFSVCLLTYMFTLTNKLVNFDDVYCVFSRGGTLESGRWGLYLIWRFLPSLSMPWLHGIITILLLSVSACVVVDAFRIRSGLIQCLVAGLFVSFPSMIGIITYMFDASAYGVALLAAVLSTAIMLGLFRKRDVANSWHFLLPLAVSIVLCVISLSIYQAFFSLTASLFLIALFRDLLSSDSDIKTTFQKAIKMLLFLVVSFLVYYLVLQFFFHRHHFTGGSYMEKMTDTGSMSFLDLLKSVYLFIPDELVSGKYGLISTRLSQITHLVVFGYICVDFILTVMHQKPLNMFGAILVLLMIPVSVCLFLLVAGNNAHSLVFFSFTAYYVLAGVLLDRRITELQEEQSLKRLLINVTSLAMVLLIGNSVFLGNSAFLKLYLAYENSYSFYGTIVTQVKSLPDLCAENKLAIIGEASTFVTDFDEFSASDRIMGATGFEVNDYSYTRFIKNFLGFDIPFATQEEIEKLVLSDEFRRMPDYPFDGSIQIIDNIVVVKLSEVGG